MAKDDIIIDDINNLFQCYNHGRHSKCAYMLWCTFNNYYYILVQFMHDNDCANINFYN